MEKLFYTMSETAALLDETPVTVRFWSNTFTKHLNPRRNAKGNRMFTPKDLETLKCIKHYTRDCGFSLEAIKKKLSGSRDGQDSSTQIRESLLRIKSRLEEIKSSL